MACELDFEATVIDERLDLIDDIVWRKAMEASFDEVRAAEGAGVEAAFFDVYDADEWRFAKNVLVASDGPVAYAVPVASIASAVLFCVTQILNK